MKRIRRLLQGRSKGLTLVEIVIAIALIAIIGVAFLGGLSQAIWSLHIADVRTTAESLARSEMEYLKSMGHDAEAEDYEYDDPTGFPGYTVKVTFGPVSGQPDADDIQEITVFVEHRDRGDVIKLVGYRARR